MDIVIRHERKVLTLPFIISAILVQEPLGKNSCMLLGISQKHSSAIFPGFSILPNPWNIFWTTVGLPEIDSSIPPVDNHCKGQQYLIFIPKGWSRPWDFCWPSNSSAGHTEYPLHWQQHLISLMTMWGFVGIVSFLYPLFAEGKIFPVLLHLYW